MKVGLIADIHANLTALQVVLKQMLPVDVLVCSGDAVGYYADVNEVCALLQHSKVLMVRGNHDAYVIGELEPKARSRKAYRTDWTREQLKDDHLQWLRSLPVELDFRWNKLKVRVRHASPWDEETYIYPDSPYLNTLTLNQGEILVLGHTHHPMRAKCGEGFVINPGSVGQPRDWNPSASYALLDTDTGEIEFRRVAYDVIAVQRRLTSLGWDTKTVAMLSRIRT